MVCLFFAFKHMGDSSFLTCTMCNLRFVRRGGKYCEIECDGFVFICKVKTVGRKEKQKKRHEICIVLLFFPQVGVSAIDCLILGLSGVCSLARVWFGAAQNRVVTNLRLTKCCPCLLELSGTAPF